MKRALFFAVSLTLAGCQGSYSTGPQIPNTVPGPGTNGMMTPGPNGITASSTPQPLSASSTYDLKDAATGFTCPSVQPDFSCVVRFNVPPPTPSPTPSPAHRPAINARAAHKTKQKKSKHAAHKSAHTPAARPSPSPTPQLTATPAPSASPSAAPSAGAPAGPNAMSFKVTVYPTDAPGFVMIAKGNPIPPTTALVRIELAPTADFVVDGTAIAQFVLPQSELQNRGFALQLFEDVQRKKRHDFQPIYNLTKSQLDKQTNTLTFTMTPPKMTLPKDHHYLLVLYGDQRTAVQPSPLVSPTMPGLATAPP